MILYPLIVLLYEQSTNNLYLALYIAIFFLMMLLIHANSFWEAVIKEKIWINTKNGFK